MQNITTIDWIALLLLVVGGINWGFIGAFNVDVVSLIFGDMTVLARVVYGLVGISAIYSLYIFSAKTA